MIPNKYFNVSKKQVSQLGIIVKQIEGLLGTGSGGYLQLHDSCIEPQTGDVPVWEIPVSTSTQFFGGFQVDGITLKEGVFVGVSSTSGTYTALVSAMKELNVWTDRKVKATVAVGDKGGPPATPLVVWSDTATYINNRIFQIVIKRTNLTASTLQLFADEAETVGPVLNIPLTTGVADTGNIQYFDFGPEGFRMWAPAATGVMHYGCVLNSFDSDWIVIVFGNSTATEGQPIQT